jgi:hypothetical protein
VRKCNEAKDVIRVLFGDDINNPIGKGFILGDVDARGAGGEFIRN